MIELVQTPRGPYGFWKPDGSCVSVLGRAGVGGGGRGGGGREVRGRGMDEEKGRKITTGTLSACPNVLVASRIDRCDWWRELRGDGLSPLY